MAVLATLCALIGLAPVLVMPAIGAATDAWTFASGGAAAAGGAFASLAELAPLGWISALGLCLAAAIAIGFLAMRAATSRAAKRLTWDCGYAKPTARMQYTASSFGDGIVGLFAAPLRSKAKRSVPRGYFPEEASCESELPDTVLDGLVLPAAAAVDRALPRFRVFQRGQTHLYVLYVLLITIVLIAFGGVGVPQ
jgi:hypothetical protein